MECPHLSEIAWHTWKNKEAPSENLKCSVCPEIHSVWVCLSCGYEGCGRYVSAHALAHAQSAQHPVCMEVKETSVFCYNCDDFIINDTSDQRVHNIRQQLQKCSENTYSSQNNENEERDLGGDTEPAHHSVKRTLRSRRKRAKSLENIEVENNRPPMIKRSRKSTETGHNNGKNSPDSELVEDRKSLRKNLVGLRNLGNTCFMSAVLQSLSNIHEFCRVLKQLPSLDSSQGNGEVAKLPRETRSKGMVTCNGSEGAIVTEELRKVLVALNQGSAGAKKAISPEALFHVIWKVVPRFRGYQQQDAHEFLRYMLDRLHTELLSLLPSDISWLQKNLSPYSRRLSNRGLAQTSSQSLVTSVFGGTLQSEVTCLTCKTSSKKHDPFLDLSIDIPNQFMQARKSKDKSSVGSTEVTKRSCNLHDCLEKFTDVEELSDADRFFCERRCNRKQPSTKKFWIRRLPNVLCLHLKRFRWSPYSRTKIDTHVEFPLVGLNMSKYLLSNHHDTRCSNSGSCLYDLAAVIVHHGSGAGSGHYTAFVIRDANWYHFNDSTVSATDPETVSKSKAYILFYIQREFQGLPPKS